MDGSATRRRKSHSAAWIGGAGDGGTPRIPPGARPTTVSRVTCIRRVQRSCVRTTDSRLLARCAGNIAAHRYDMRWWSGQDLGAACVQLRGLGAKEETRAWDRWQSMPMAYEALWHEYMQMPVVTRAYTTACVITTLAVVSIFFFHLPPAAPLPLARSGAVVASGSGAFPSFQVPRVFEFSKLVVPRANIQVRCISGVWDNQISRLSTLDDSAYIVLMLA